MAWRLNSFLGGSHVSIADIPLPASRSDSNHRLAVCLVSVRRAVVEQHLQPPRRLLLVDAAVVEPLSETCMFCCASCGRVAPRLGHIDCGFAALGHRANRFQPHANSIQGAIMSAIDHSLDTLPANDAWRRRMLRRSLGRVAPSETPQAIIVAGPPGSGKTTVIDEVCRWFADFGQCAVIDSRELALQHPDVAQWLSEPETELFESELISAANQLADELIDTASSLRLPLVIETRCDNVTAVLSQARRLREAGYATEVIALMVSLDECRQALRERAEFWQQDIGQTPFESAISVEESQQQFDRLLAALTDDRTVVAIHRIDRRGQPPNQTRVVNNAIVNSDGVMNSVAPQTVETSDGRKVRIGQFTASGATSIVPPKVESNTLAATVNATNGSTRTVRLGKFATGSPIEVTAGEGPASGTAPSWSIAKPIVSKNSARSSVELTPMTAQVVVDSSGTVDIAVERRRRLQMKLRSRAGLCETA